MPSHTSDPRKGARAIRVLHPQTTALTEGFDPALSVMAARPPIYPVSTYCFRNSSEAKLFFEMALGKVEAPPGTTQCPCMIVAPNCRATSRAFHHPAARARGATAQAESRRLTSARNAPA